MPRFISYCLLAMLLSPLTSARVQAQETAADRPNILWITCEDLSPILGCYGDEAARTPTLDQLAIDGVRYTNAFANAPCCSPARSCIITGVHPSSLGTMHLRSVTPKPDFIPCYTEYLRAAGYYCTNNVKEDYQFTTPAAAWDESSIQAHWRNRGEGQPFFAVFNLMVTHQSRVRYEGEELAKATSHLKPEDRHDPATIPLPPYYPDTPITRKYVAQLYDLATEMDYQVADLLAQLDEDGVADDTIVFFYSDHGSGIPRGKRWLFDSGLQVPMILRFPEKYKHLAPKSPGRTEDRLVSFVDLAPTMLSLLDLPIPEYMDGVAFLGPQAGPPREYVFGCRDRVDEVYETARSVRDHRFKYIRNFTPHRPRMPYSTYSERTPIRPEIRRLGAEGKLSGAPAEMVASSKPVEEFYDLENDPWELNNLIDDPRYRAERHRMRVALRDWLIEQRDLGLLPEAEMYSRCPDGVTPYEMRLDDDLYPFEDVLDAAMLVGVATEPSAKLLAGEDSAEVYWGLHALTAMGKRQDAKDGMTPLVARITKDDPAPAVRIAAAEVLGVNGRCDEALATLYPLLDSDQPWIALEAASTIKRLAPTCRPDVDLLKAKIAEKRPHFSDMFFDWALEHALRRIGEFPEQ